MVWRVLDYRNNSSVNCNNNYNSSVNYNNNYNRSVNYNNNYNSSVNHNNYNYKDPAREIEFMWIVKTEVISLLIQTTVTILK
jgi:hypothetical protein